MSADRDVLGLLALRSVPQVRFGAADASLALKGGTMHQALDHVGSATVLLHPELLPPDPVDYVATLEVRSGWDEERVLFSGHAETASGHDGGVIEVSALGARALTEQVLGSFTHVGVELPEIAYLMARAAGMEEGQLVIEGLEELPVEVFEVFVPLDGVRVDEPRVVADIRLLPSTPVLESLKDMGFESGRDLERASAFALSVQTARLGYEAEQRGLTAIDTALSWLITRMRYGLALLPDGQPQQYRREHARAMPRRGELVAVRGLATGRRWLRSSAMEARGATVDLAEHDPLLDRWPDELPTTDRLALDACRRLAGGGEPLIRVQALWEAAEFLVAGVRTPKRFPKADLQRVKGALPTDLSTELRAQAEKAIGNLNQVPLLDRLRYLVERDGLPCSDAELDLLGKLRDVRNDAAHGRSAEVPSPEALDHATAVMCRMVAFKLWQHSASEPSPVGVDAV